MPTGSTQRATGSSRVSSGGWSCLGCGCLVLVVGVVLGLLIAAWGLLTGGDDEAPPSARPTAGAPTAERTGKGAQQSAKGAEKSGHAKAVEGTAQGKKPAADPTAGTRGTQSPAPSRRAARPEESATAQAPRPAASTRSDAAAPVVPVVVPPPAAAPQPTNVPTHEPAQEPEQQPSRAEQAETTSDARSDSPHPMATRDNAMAASGWVVKVVDGDTIDVALASGVERVRVIGIDTPEIGECGFEQASSTMRSLVGGTVVTLVKDPTQDDRDRYDRLVRHVRMGNGSSAAVQMIRQGRSAEYLYGRPYVGRGDHLAAEQRARAERLGIWGASGCLTPQPAPTSQPAPTQPAPVAQQPTTPAAPVAPPARSCRIKGNISSDGEKIFHSPGQRHYEQTKIALDKGERMFCSAADAIEAGWRAAKV